jgi:kinesin family member 2/24
LILENGIDGCRTLEDTSVNVSFFELYSGGIQDLLNERNRCKLLEDGKGEIQVQGLKETEVETVSQLQDIMRTGATERTTHTTEANDSSSRSHSICQIILREKHGSASGAPSSGENSGPGKFVGKISLVDLAGSERGSDVKLHSSQRQAETAEINTSLLALKECIRALDGIQRKGGDAAKHVPYRASPLTKILKDCFTSPDAMTTMIATISPGLSQVDHTLNTLRYADRIKELRAGDDLVARKFPAPTRQNSVPSLGASRDANPPGASTLVRTESFSSSKESSQLPVSGSLLPSDATQQPLSSSSAPSSPVATRINGGGDDDDDVVIGTAPRSNQSGTPDEERELRKTVRSLFQQEESMLNLHMSNLQVSAALLTEEASLLQDVQLSSEPEDLERYVTSLERILDQKEQMIVTLHDKIEAFEENLRKEQELSQLVGPLPQY